MFYKLSLLSLASAALGATTPLAAQQELAERTVYSGEATFYYQDGVAGSCGETYSDSAYIGALSTYWMDDGKDYCNGEIIVTATTGPASGKPITILIADTCASCDETHIDLSSGAFGALSDDDYDLGVIDISWYFNFTPQ